MQRSVASVSPLVSEGRIPARQGPGHRDHPGMARMLTGGAPRHA